MIILLMRRLQDNHINANRFLITMQRAIRLFDVESYHRNGRSGNQGARIVCEGTISHLGPTASAKLMILGRTAENQASNELESHLLIAILLDDTKLLRNLIDEGVDVCMKNRFFGIPLRLAAQEGCVEVLDALLAHSRNSRTFSKQIAKALRASCQRGHRLQKSLKSQPYRYVCFAIPLVS